MIIKEVKAVLTPDSRKETTIKFIIKTNKGVFSTTAPSGKSRGKWESKPWKKNVLGDLEILNKVDKKIIESVRSFEELEIIEKKYGKKIGANSLFILEATILKALAKDKGKELWKYLNPQARRVPKPLGNAIGGGLHSKEHVPVNYELPEFQEFLYYCDNKKISVEEAVKLNDKAYQKTGEVLKKYDPKFLGTTNDEGAWISSLSNEEIIMIMREIGLTYGLRIGVDVAASTYYKNKKYHYHNGMTIISKEEQIHYMNRIIEKYELGYIEDPMTEEDYKGFEKITKESGEKSMITGDDLTVTHLDRLRKAINEGSINAIIIKPNQNGSLLSTKKVLEMAKKNNIKIIISHRSGESEDDTIADLGVAWGADYLKCGVKGKVRRAKLKRLITIERMIKGKKK